MRRLALALLLVASTALAATDNFPRIWQYRQNSTSGGLWLLNAGGDLRGGQLQTIAIRDRGRWRLQTADIDPWANIHGFSRGDMLDSMELYQNNPKLLGTGSKPIVLLYQLLQNWFHTSSYVPSAADSSFNEDFDRQRLALNGVLFNQGGTVDHTDAGYNLNWCSRAFADSIGDMLVNACKMASPGADGVFFDYFDMRPKWTGESPNTPYNFAAMGAVDGPDMNRQFCDNLGRMVDKLHAAGKMVFVNAAGASQSDSFFFHHPVEGDMREGFDCYNCSGGGITTFTQALTFVQGSKPTYKLLKAEAPNAAPNAADNTHAARFILGTSCLGDGWAWIGQGPGGRCLLGGGGDWRCGFYDEYSVTPDGVADTTGKHTGWLGQPTGPARKIGSVDVWRRDFQNGVVIVNGTGSNVPVAVQFMADGRPLKFIKGVVDPTTNTGQQVNNMVIPFKDARFLCPACPLSGCN